MEGSGIAADEAGATRWSCANESGWPPSNETVLMLAARLSISGNPMVVACPASSIKGVKKKTLLLRPDFFLAVQPTPLSRIVLAFRSAISGRYAQ